MTTRLAPIPRSRAKTAYGLLSDVVKAIRKEPKRVNMDMWIYAYQDMQVAEFWQGEGNAPACGTVGCIAGWVALLKRPWRTSALEVQSQPAIRAAQLLGWAHHLGNELLTLFTGELSEFSGIPPGTQAYADKVIERIQDFQHTHKARLRAKRV